MKMSSFKPIPLNIVGQSYESRSRALSIQRTMNLIPAAELTGASQSSLMSWPGCVNFYAASGLDRGMTKFNDELYKVTDQTLWKIDSLSAATNLGTIAGSSRCIFANDGTNLIITQGSTGYQLTGSTLTQITDPDFVGGNSVAYLNLKMIFDSAGGRFQVADAGNPDSIQPNNFATAESAPDDTIRMFVFNERFNPFGTSSVETWYDTGSGNPPVGRVNGGTMNVGLFAVHSVADTEDFVYFLGSDKRVYRFSSHQPEAISTNAIAHQLDACADLTDAIGYIVTVEGQNIYVLNSVLSNRTFAFNESSGAWFELSTGAAQNYYIGTSYVECYGKRLIADGGNVHELSLTTYTDNGAVKIQERVFGPINGDAVGSPGSRLLMSYVDFIMDLGVGIATGQGSKPQALVSLSFDGGKSFTNERDVLLGRTGEGRIKARYDHTESFYDCFIKIKVSDPVFIALFTAAIGIKASGH